MLLELKEGDILALDYPVDRPLDLMVNGKVKYQGEVVGTGRKRAIQIRQIGQTQPAPAPAALAVAASEPSPKPPAK